MKNIAALVIKELNTYFVSPIAYFVSFIFTAISGFLFSMILLNFSAYQEPSTLVMQILFNNVSVTLLQNHYTLSSFSFSWRTLKKSIADTRG